MATIGAYEAKVHFSELLKKVEEGGTVTVTRHGVPVARIVPFHDAFADSAAAIDEWRQYRDKHQITLGEGITIRELIEDGRK